MTTDASPTPAIYCRGCGSPLERAPRHDGATTVSATPPTAPPTSIPEYTYACAKCGRAFDPWSPKTFDRVDPRRRRRDLIVGLACAVVLACAAVGAAVGLAQMGLTSFESAFGAHLAAGLAIGIVASVLAGRNRSLVAVAFLLLAGTLAIWIGLFMAVDDGYRSWQRMPDPPDEAFSDGPAPIAAFLLGWVPAGTATALVFMAARLLSRDRQAERREIGARPPAPPA